MKEKIDQFIDREPEQGGLPRQAFALVENSNDPDTWQLPHHTPQVRRALKGKIGMEHTVDWELMDQAVFRLSNYGRSLQPLGADENQVLAAAQHLAGHYRKAGKPLPLSLAIVA